MSLTIFAVGTSILCSKTSFVISIINGCPALNRLIFNFPANVSKESYDSGNANPDSEDGGKRLIDIEVSILMIVFHSLLFKFFL